jgi:hypothetical protein
VESNQRIIREASPEDVQQMAVRYLNLEGAISCLSGEKPN